MSENQDAYEITRAYRKAMKQERKKLIDLIQKKSEIELLKNSGTMTILESDLEREIKISLRKIEIFRGKGINSVQ